MPIIDHFGLLAPFYERFIPPSVADQLVELLDIEPGLKLLDVGGGTGRVSQALVDRFDEVFLSDLSHKMLSQAADKKMKLVQSHGEILPFEDNTFDRVIIVDALHHVCDQQDTANELFRVLSPGGRLIIEEPNFEHFSVKIVAAVERIALMRSRFLPPPDILDLFRNFNHRSKIVRVNYTSWILIEKLGEA